jgi:hypothetical protein
VFSRHNTNRRWNIVIGDENRCLSHFEEIIITRKASNAVSILPEKNHMNRKIPGISELAPSNPASFVRGSDTYLPSDDSIDDIFRIQQNTNDEQCQTKNGISIVGDNKVSPGKDRIRGLSIECFLN